MGAPIGMACRLGPAANCHPRIVTYEWSPIDCHPEVRVLCAPQDLCISAVRNARRLEGWRITLRRRGPKRTPGLTRSIGKVPVTNAIGQFDGGLHLRQNAKSDATDRIG